LHEPLGGFPPETFQRRRERALAALGDGVLLLPAAPLRFKSRDTEHPYRPDSELYYLTGLTEPDLVAVLRGGESGGLTLFARERDPELELWSGERLGPERVAELTGAEAVHPLAALEEELPGLITGPLDLHYRMGADPRTDRLVLDALARGRARGARRGTGPRALVDPGEVLDDLRLIKDEHELARLRRAASITVDAFRAALAATTPGMGEWELQAVLDGGFRRSGGDGPGYETIVGGGKRACVLHYVENRCRVAATDLVLIDAGAALGLYHADITRTWPVGGRFGGEQRAVYEVVESARTAAMATVRPGTTIAAVHEAAVAVMVAGLLELGVLEGDPAALAAEDKHKPFYPHQTSHWLGLDVHDVGDYARGGQSRVLEPGMVFTIEPGLYFRPGIEGAPSGRFEGIGVRIEDDVLVTSAGCENLTGALPTGADQIAELVGRAP
jgi:Xaa-Pro aminopeptidase